MLKDREFCQITIFYSDNCAENHLSTVFDSFLYEDSKYVSIVIEKKILAGPMSVNVISVKSMFFHIQERLNDHLTLLKNFSP